MVYTSRVKKFVEEVYEKVPSKTDLSSWILCKEYLRSYGLSLKNLNRCAGLLYNRVNTIPETVYDRYLKKVLKKKSVLNLEKNE